MAFASLQYTLFSSPQKRLNYTAIYVCICTHTDTYRNSNNRYNPCTCVLLLETGVSEL